MTTIAEQTRIARARAEKKILEAVKEASDEMYVTTGYRLSEVKVSISTVQHQMYDTSSRGFADVNEVSILGVRVGLV